MKYEVSVNEPYCYVEVHRNTDPCETGCACLSWVGGFGFEKSEGSVVIHDWDFQPYDHGAARHAVDYFREVWAKKNNVKNMFVERSEADTFWMGLGWEAVGKCEMLLRKVDGCA